MGLYLRVISILTVLVLPALASNARKPQNALSHGTINILLANGNGMVLVTDSRATALNGTHFDTSVKLFRLDDSTACTIAGLANAPSPYPALGLQVAGIITDFSDTLSQRALKLTFEQKLKSLSWLLQNNLWKLAELYGESADVKSFPDPHLEVLIGGYDLDRTARIAKLVIDLRRTDQFEPTVSVDEREVKGDLEFLTAGLDLDAQSRLHYPQNFTGEPALTRYTTAKRGDNAAHLSLAELGSLAEYLEQDAAKRPVFGGTQKLFLVGGPIQKAVLTSGGEMSLSGIPALVHKVPPYKFYLVADVGFTNLHPAAIKFEDEISALYLRVDCKNSDVDLDNAQFYEGTYDHCYFLYKGGNFYVDPSVTLQSSYLVIDPVLLPDVAKIRSVHQMLPTLTLVTPKESASSPRMK